MFKKLLNAAAELTGKARKFAAPITDRAYLRAALAVGFLVGGADGDFDPDERAGLVSLIKQDPTLSGFNDDQITDAFEEVEKLYAITMPMGRKKSLKLISEITDREQREALTEFAAVVATLDGEVGEDERVMVQKISDATGIAVDEDLLEV